MSWCRCPSGLLLPPLLFFIIDFFAPDSHTWLKRKGNDYDHGLLLCLSSQSSLITDTCISSLSFMHPFTRQSVVKILYLDRDVKKNTLTCFNLFVNYSLVSRTCISVCCKINVLTSLPVSIISCFKTLSFETFWLPQKQSRSSDRTRRDNPLKTEGLVYFQRCLIKSSKLWQLSLPDGRCTRRKMWDGRM